MYTQFTLICCEISWEICLDLFPRENGGKEGAVEVWGGWREVVLMSHWTAMLSTQLLCDTVVALNYTDSLTIIHKDTQWKHM